MTGISLEMLRKFQSATPVDAWAECVELIDVSKNWLFRYHWSDDRIHELGTLGHGQSSLDVCVPFIEISRQNSDGEVT